MTDKARTDGTICVAATFTAEPLLPGLCFALEAAGLPLDVSFAPYNQVLQELLAPTSMLARNAGGIDVVLVRLEDFTRDAANIDDAHDIIDRIVPELCNALIQHGRRVQVPTIFAALPPSPRSARSIGRDIETANAALVAHVRSIPGLILLSPEDIDQVSTQDRYDEVADDLGHVPFTEEHYSALALAIARKVHALRVPAHKVLVLDCDETLWRGVVGEDGVDGISIPPHLARLQDFAVKIQAQGILICLVSKNSERDVFDVFEKRPDMVLKLDNVVAHRINWEPKPRNIASLARALNLGLDSFVFIDDNPVECALVLTELPQVVTLQLPPDNEIDSFLSHLWVFDKVAVTEEDARRTAMYRENAARQEYEESATDIAAFIASLEVVTDMSAPEDGEWPRLAQLTQRTNQFNFTTMRRTEPEMRALPSGGYSVLRVKVRDRFGDYGIVGLVVAHQVDHALEVDTFLLSCRVLGRGVEHTILRRLGEMARERALSSVDLCYAATSKNEPARAFIESVAAQFRLQEQDKVVYRIPGDAALGIAHRPGHDPEAVTEARRAEERKAPASGALGNSIDRSERYSGLARTLTSGTSVVEAIRVNAAQRRVLPDAAIPAKTETERALSGLWQRHLSVEGLGVEDDYFALGGTSLTAARLFADMARQFGITLPLTTILEAPTIRTLARRLEQQSHFGSETLVELKCGGSRNLFLVHDGYGEVLLYRNLAQLMPVDVGVYGVEPRHRSGIPLAHLTIEEMAAYYLDKIRKKQTEGPYLLGGMCAGGVIAFEMAAQLESAGEKVELLALLDASTPQAVKRKGRLGKARHERLRQAIEQIQSAEYGPLKQTRLVLGTILRKLTNALIWEIEQRPKRWMKQLRLRLLRGVLKRGIPWPGFVPSLDTQEIYNAVEARYMPARLQSVPTLLVRARCGEGVDIPFREVYEDDMFGWGSHVDDLGVVDVEGGHSSMLQEQFVDSLAKALMPYVDSKKTTATRSREFEVSTS